MISEARLDKLKVRYEQELLDRATITQPSTTETRDEFGEVTTPSATIGEDVKCSWRTLDGSEKLVAGGVAAIGDILLHFEAAMVGVIKADMKIEVAARAPHPAKTFQVKRPLESSLMVGLRVLATES